MRPCVIHGIRPWLNCLICSGRHGNKYSVGSLLWEIAIKQGLRRKDFTIDIDALMTVLPASDFIESPFTALHAVGVAQSMAEPMTLLTNDAALGGYWDGVK